MYSSRSSLSHKATGKARSDGQKATLLENRTALLYQIEKWRQIQMIYMPGVLDVDANDLETSPQVKAESIILWLPSQLDARDQDTICLGGIVSIEKELWFVQLEDSLNDLRRARRTRRGLIVFHKVQLTGQGQKTQTKSQAAMRTIQDRIDRCARRYRVAREALLRLSMPRDWCETYPPLTNDDNRGPGKEPEESLGPDGQYTPSWIWLSSTTVISPDEVNKDMRVEWAQCMSRADRWEEEVTLLQEEMRRTVEFLEWRSGDWLTKADLRMDNISPAVRSGLSAYANKQGSIFHHLAVRFCQQWRTTLVSLLLPHDWATKFLTSHKEPLDDPGFKKRNRLKHLPYTQPSASAAAPTHVTPLPVIPEAVDDGTPVSDVDSDGTLSEDDESGSESVSSLSE